MRGHPSPAVVSLDDVLATVLVLTPGADPAKGMEGKPAYHLADRIIRACLELDFAYSGGAAKSGSL